MVIVDDVAETVRTHPAVPAVELIGSRARGDATELSGWDLRIDTEDFAAVAADLPCLLARHHPLAAQWDRLSVIERHLTILPGPTKIDLIFPDVPRTPAPPWRIGPDTLQAVDAHFWDWMLRLTAKWRAGKTDRVRGELLTMSTHLLEPLGITTTPLNLTKTADLYLRARDRLEHRYRQRLPRHLQAEILPLIHHYRSTGLAS